MASGCTASSSPHGIENPVIDSSSLEVNRRLRRAKTDRMDLEPDCWTCSCSASCRQLEERVFSVVRVPTRGGGGSAPPAPGAAHECKRDRTRLTNRMQGLLANQGLTLDLKRTSPHWQLDGACGQWDGTALPAGLRARLDQRAGATRAF